MIPKRLETSSRVHSLAEKWRTKTIVDESLSGEEKPGRVSIPAEPGSFRREMTPLRIALPILLQRRTTGYRRTPGILEARIALVFGFAAIMTLFWAPLRSEYEDIQSRIGYVQQQMG